MYRDLTTKELENVLQEQSFQYYNAFIEENKDEVEFLRNDIFIAILEYMKRKIDKVYNLDNVAEKEEVISKSLTTILRKLDNNEYDPYYNETSKFSAFIISIMKGQTRNSKGKLVKEIARTEVKYENKYDIVQEVALDDVEDNFTKTNKDIHLDELMEIILSIAKNDEEREFIKLAFIHRVLDDTISNKELAEMFNCSPAYISKRIKKIKERLKEALADYVDLIK